MTAIQKIKACAEKLAPAQQAVVLSFIDALASESTPKPSVKKARPRKSSIDAALRAAAGLWKDRTDLPKDAVAASRLLRRRLMRRPNSV